MYIHIRVSLCKLFYLSFIYALLYLSSVDITYKVSQRVKKITKYVDYFTPPQAIR